MVSGLFHLHGMWVGRVRQGDENNVKGYFENLDIKKLLLQYYGRMDAPKEYDARFAREVKQFLPDVPFVIKHSALYWEAWKNFDPKWVFVRRNIESCVKSCKKTGFAGKDPLPLIEKHQVVMDHVKNTYGGVDIYSDDLIAGDYSSLERAFKYCGIEIDPEIVKGFIEPNLWRH